MRPDAETFTCPLCRRTTHNPTDVAYQYCGACHQFWPDVGQRLARLEEMLQLVEHSVLTLVETINGLTTALMHTDHYGLGRSGLPPSQDVPPA